MTRLRATIALLVLGFTCAQTQAQPVSMQAELLKDWTAMKDMMHKIAAEMPADKYTYKPTPDQQSFGERVVHVAGANVGILGSLGGSVAKPTIDPKATTKEAALKALDDSFDYGIALLKAESDETLRQAASGAPKFMGPSSRARIFSFLAGHTQDIYGQLAVYLRLNGQVPPASKKM